MHVYLWECVRVYQCAYVWVSPSKAREPHIAILTMHEAKTKAKTQETKRALQRRTNEGKTERDFKKRLLRVFFLFKLYGNTVVFDDRWRRRRGSKKRKHCAMIAAAIVLRSCCWGIVKVAKMCSRDNLLGLLLLWITNTDTETHTHTMHTHTHWYRYTHIEMMSEPQGAHQYGVWWISKGKIHIYMYRTIFFFHWNQTKNNNFLKHSRKLPRLHMGDLFNCFWIINQ